MRNRTLILWMAGLLFALARPGQAPAQKRDQAPAFPLFDPGTEAIVAYEKYGVLTNLGTSRYRYLIRDREALARAVGEGIYPNVTGLLKDPAYQKMQYERKLEGSAWDFVNSDNLQANFFKWSSDRDQTAGLRQYYAARMLEKAGLYVQAIKAYQATVIHFPKGTGSTYWKTPWYVGPNALDAMAFLTRQHPELGMGLKGGRIRIRNRFDEDPLNDLFEIDPGRIVRVSPKARAVKRFDATRQPLRRQIGKGRVRLNQYEHGNWQLLVEGKPYFVRGMSYSATPIGKSPDTGSWVVHQDWMTADQNKNGRVDGPADSWVDRNGNGRQDPEEPAVGDWKLLQEMGVNTLRLYHHGSNKALLKDLYDTYGIRVIMGDFLGVYAIGSGAEWETGTDYTDPIQQEKMLASIKGMVEEYKNEPYILFWMLGNENNYGVANNSRENPDLYYELVNRAARLIKSLDPEHPVALSSGDLLFLNKAARLCPEVDIFSSNAYRGEQGFGDSFWQDLREEWGKPVLIGEFGCPAFHRNRTMEEAEALQADYLRNNWIDVERNFAGGPGTGNAIGGVLFEWMDEWWKAGGPPTYDPAVHDTTGQFAGPFPGGWMYEEWLGLAGQGEGKNSPLERHLRQAYFMFKDELWNPKEWKKRGLP